MHYQPEHLKPWTSADPAFGSTNNYAGADLSAFYVAPISMGRDTADSLTLSNWRVVSAELESKAQHEESGEHEFGHWAMGWYRLWLIHESDTAALQCADEWAASLANYPVADEEALSELESEAESEAWDSWAGREWRDAVESALDAYAPDDAGPYWADELLETLPGDADNFHSLWHELTKECSWWCVHESDGPSLNIEEPAKLLTVTVLSELTGLTLLSPEQQWRSEPYPWPDGSTAPLVAPLPLSFK
jgi:hypothetical protein